MRRIGISLTFVLCVKFRRRTISYFAKSLVGMVPYTKYSPSSEVKLKKLGRVGKDRPIGINLKRSLGFSDRENPRTLAPP